MSIAKKNDLQIPLHTIQSQQRAANPRASAWVSANAGAGKTKVLTDRVLRLLLAGALPGRILCLTFTKAAAANMSIRVFERLGAWVTLSDAELEEELHKLEGRKPSRIEIRNARRLFARAIETPGGLKIETLHAFCERLLHLVPFEANVPARFSVLDENLSGELTERMIVETLGEIAIGQESELAEAWTIVSAATTGDGLRNLLQTALRQRELANKSGLKCLCQKLAKALAIDPAKTPHMIRQDVLARGFSEQRLEEIYLALSTSPKPSDQSRANDIKAVLAANDTDTAFAAYHTIFFTKAGSPRSEKAFITKSIAEDIRQDLFEERDRLEAADDILRAHEAYQRTAALYQLASSIKQRVEREKMRLGALDFDDLVHKTLEVLSRSDAAWILYKLDRGIDHVLVDEAQDTNPEQWQILRLITEDFTAGIGIERRHERTLFAVGDPKQSIYGFQGAAPHEFELSRKYWSRRVMDAGKSFEDVRLTLSFRSVKAVLSAVDATFSIPENFKGLSFDDEGKTQHDSARVFAPGQVILWPVERPSDQEEPEAWVLPVDQPEASSPPVIVARRIAQTVADWISKGDETGRRWRAGDVLILVRKRSAAFEAVIRALKEKGVPVAGQDRIDIGNHIAVLDLIAAGRSALLPEDDLTLATALKSPLVGLSEDDLFTLAAHRGEKASLIEAIQYQAEAGNSAAIKAQKALTEWRELAKDLGPFAFFATLLGPLKGRASLVARLGTEAGDAIDAFLSFARNAEMAETPSLLSFLARFDASSHSIKRDFESARDEVRVMTVHGAKGLEAPVTILIDGCDVLGRDGPLVSVAVSDDVTVPVWTTKKADSSITAEARSALREKALEEHHRLLYVAMTRAKDKLVIAPFMTSAKGDVPEKAWNEMIRRGLEDTPQQLTQREESFGSVLIWQEGEATAFSPTADLPALSSASTIPDWLTQPAPSEPEPLPPLRPSTALSAAQMPPQPEGATRFRASGAKARLRGTLAHTLIEKLPDITPEQRRQRAEHFLATQAPSWRKSEQDKLIEDVLGLLAEPRLAALFSPEAHAEVPISGTVETTAGTLPISGQIDRFVVLNTEILIADFKTSAHPPAAHEPITQEYVLQLALYARLLAELYPTHKIRPFVIWTHGPVIREVQAIECAEALRGL